MSRTSGIHFGMGGGCTGLIGGKPPPTFECIHKSKVGGGLPPMRPVAAPHPSIEHEQRIIAELRFEPMRRHWPPEQVALYLVATMLAQEVQLLVGFHALGDHRQVQAVGHGDDCAGDLRVLLAGRQAVDEGAVDLEHVDGELLEVVER